MQVAAHPRHPHEAACALDLEELVGTVVVAADEHVGRVRHLHHPEEIVPRVLPQRDRRRLEEQRPLAHHRLHAAHLLVDEPQRHRVLVHDVVEEVAAGTLIVEAPRVSGRIEVRLELRFGAADDGLDPHDRRRADDARRDEIARLAQRRVVTRLLGHPEDHAHVGSGCHHPPAVGNRVGNRLLHRHVLPGARGRDHVLGVQRSRPEDLDRVDLVVGEQRGEIRIRPVDAPLAGDAARARRRAGHTARSRRSSRVRGNRGR